MKMKRILGIAVICLMLAALAVLVGSPTLS